MLTAWLAFTRSYAVPMALRLGPWTGDWWLAFLGIALMVGFRHKVGGDWFNYQQHIDMLIRAPLSEAFEKGEPAYGLLNWLGANWLGGQYLSNLVCGVIFSSGLVAFCRTQPRPWLALVVAVPYLITVLGMGYTRQGVAIGTAMLGLSALSRGEYVKYGVWTGFGVLFHKSAVILVPIVFLSNSQRKLLSLALMAGFAALIYFFLFKDVASAYVKNYMEAEMESTGAAIRVAMNALPAMIFLLFRQRFGLDAQQLTFWTWMAGFALAFVVLLKLVASSTAVDRVALYWIPLQLMVWSRFPDAFGQPHSPNVGLNLAVIAYSAGVYFVWLNFAIHSRFWIPYQFYPWVALWQ